MAYKMKGFSGFKDSPVKAADEGLVESAGSMYSDKTAETIASIDPTSGLSLGGGGKEEEDPEDKTKKTKKKKGKGLLHFLAGAAGRAKMDSK